MITSHGCIPELDNLSVSSMKGIYTKQKETSDSTETPKLPLIRRFVVRYLKNKFLENSAHRQFWVSNFMPPILFFVTIIKHGSRGLTISQLCKIVRLHRLYLSIRLAHYVVPQLIDDLYYGEEDRK
ncbi:hypothetical protein D915_010135 [Fasciola hepatica]|uniref:Uncharacterized protein n=1 Tax=Fasciola hepatica TaxID=6192 RepID=A0A4E0QUD0_FASHE|nr:hypothetical protein D915_010135 [Fasciola hepatica]